MQTLNHSVNPFAQMCDPDAVKNALAHAAKWTLKSRVCHPLDRPSRTRLNREQAAFDAQIEAGRPDEPE
jgi:hypothetical protein